jgi:hypothetical protein
MAAEVIGPRMLEGLVIRQKLKVLLASRGRNARKGGDYYIVDSDSDPYEQKVLTFHDKVLDKRTIKAVSKMLERHSMDWSVQFVKANKDGTEVVPETGVEVCSYDLVMNIHPFMTPKQAKDLTTTAQLYDVLDPLFAAHGTPYEDYHLQDDNWPLLTHNIYFVKIELLTPSLINEVQKVLERFSNCMLLVNIGTKEPFEDVRVVMRVYADRIEEDWDRDAMRAIFKDKFKF